jgi:hypothetical protein
MTNSFKTIDTTEGKRINVSDKNYEILKESLQSSSQNDKISIDKLEKILREKNLVLKKDDQDFKIKNFIVN